MDSLRAGVLAAIDAFVKRSAEQRVEATRAMRQALTQRTGGDTRKSSAAIPKPPPVGLEQPPPPSVPQRKVFGPARTEEAVLVAALFTKPQTLAAAFIVAEVLAKPVALRDP